jgi:hypothetical protein
MFGFGIKNLRRLEDVPTFDIKPITILVGRNSSGKSSYLRALPLLRQSVTTRTSSPILWFGNWVDFGDFDRAVLDNKTELQVTFSFSLDHLSIQEHVFYDSLDDSGFVSFGTHEFCNVQLSIAIVKHKQGTRIRSIKLNEANNLVEYEVELSENSAVERILVNGSDQIKYLDDWRLIASSATIFPSVRLVSQTKKDADLSLRVGEPNPIQKRLMALVEPYLDQRIKADSLRQLTRQLLSLDTVSQSSVLQLSTKGNNQSWKKLLNDIGTLDRHNLFPEIRNLLLLNLFRKILNAMSSELQEKIRSVLYIGPARAKSDRYYRYQDLSVSEIDPDGQNFPMFLNSLSASQMLNFSAWIKELYGYGVHVERQSGHIEINLLYGEKTVNVVDTGYGISQILPVLGQVWWANNRAPTRRTAGPTTKSVILAIEQPELHLHPAHQALLADAFVNATSMSKGAQGKEGTISFIIETHSEAMINRLGALVSEKKISSDDLQILLFEENLNDLSKTTVRPVTFDSDGVLVNWPYDFFIPKIYL